MEVLLLVVVAVVYVEISNTSLYVSESYCVPRKVMIIASRNLYIYPVDPGFLQNKNWQSWTGEHRGGLGTPEEAGVTRGLVPGGLRHPGTESVCL